MRKIKRKLLLFILSVGMLCVLSVSSVYGYEYEMVDMNGNLIDPDPAPASALTHVKVKVSENYKYAFQVLQLVNKERKAYGLQSLKMDKGLLATAMLRAAENVLYYSPDHLRPENTYCFTANNDIIAENCCAGVSSAKAAMNSWMNSPGHRANILSGDVVSIGVGCVKYGGVYYWVQDFGMDAAQKVSASQYKNKNKTRSIGVDKYDTSMRPVISLSSTKIKVGKSASVKVKWDNGYTIISLKESGIIIKSANPKICKVKNGKIYGLKKGTAKIRFYYPGNEKRAVTKTVKVVK